MTDNESSNLATPLAEQLVAYLDGELDPESGRRIEELLASNPEARRRLQVMERTWELLDELESPPVGEKFTHTTLEMVALAARKDVEQSLAEAPKRRRRRLLAIGGGLLAGAAVGFLAVVLLVDPNRRLLRDLPVLENYDQYRQVGSFKFLELLRDENPFPAETENAAPGEPAKAEVPMRQRRQYVESLSPNDKELLRVLQERFASLDHNHQQQLRELHESLSHAPDAVRLRHVMQHYCDWAASLPSYSRAELAELGPEERVKWIKNRLQEDQAPEGGRRVSRKDAQVLWKWMIECAKEHEADFLKSLSEPERDRLAALSAESRHRAFVITIRAVWPLGPGVTTGRPPMMTDDDLARLRAAATPEMLGRLDKLTPPEQWQTVGFWIRQVLRQQVAPRAMRGRLPNEDDERLADFFEKELSLEERDRLLNLPGDEVQRELLRLYMRRTRPPEGSGRGREGSRRRGFDGERPAPKIEKESPPDVPL